MDLYTSNNKRMNDLVQEAFDIYLSIPTNVKMILSYSGGKDSTVFVIIAIEAMKLGLIDKKQIEIVYADTLQEFPHLHKQAIVFMEYIHKTYGIKYTIVTPRVHNSLLARIIGEGSFAPSWRTRWCVEDIKIKPITKYIKSINEPYVMIVGIRLDESASRERDYTNVKQVPNYSCDTQGECFAPMEDESRAFPILNWKSCNIWDFIQFEDMSQEFPIGNLREIYMNQNDVRYGCWNCTVTVNKTLDIFVRKYKKYKPLVELYNKQWNYTSLDEGDRRDWIYVLREKGKHKGKWTPIRLTIAARKKYFDMIMEAQKLIQKEDPNFIILSKDEAEYIKKAWKKWPDGDQLNRKWKYFHQTRLYHYQNVM